VAGHRHTVLVVDDDPDVREALATYLRTEGCLVVEAEDGDVGLRALARGVDPCIVLLDLMMPGVDGWQFRTAQVREQGVAGIPVAIVSAYPDPPEVGPNGFAQAYLQKPVDFDQLLGLVTLHCPHRPRDVAPTAAAALGAAARVSSSTS
jgi:CheY-like chemotaxis protein